MKTTLKIAAFALTSFGMAAFTQAAPSGKSPHPMRYHRVDSHKSTGTLLEGVSRCAKCESPKGAKNAKPVRIGGKRKASAKKA